MEREGGRVMMMVVVGWMHDKGCPEEYPPSFSLFLTHLLLSHSLSLSFSLSVHPVRGSLDQYFMKAVISHIRYPSVWIFSTEEVVGDV